jgi:hypothetical protein
MSQRSTFLIVVAGLALHISVLSVCLAVIGYWIFEWSDRWQAKHDREKVFLEECKARGIDPKSQTQEISTSGVGAMVKLDAHRQIVVTRVLDVLRRLP